MRVTCGLPSIVVKLIKNGKKCMGFQLHVLLDIRTVLLPLTEKTESAKNEGGKAFILVLCIISKPLLSSYRPLSFSLLLQVKRQFNFHHGEFQQRMWISAFVECKVYHVG